MFEVISEMLHICSQKGLGLLALSCTLHDPCFLAVISYVESWAVVLQFNSWMVLVYSCSKDFFLATSDSKVHSTCIGELFTSLERKRFVHMKVAPSGGHLAGEGV